MGNKEIIEAVSMFYSVYLEFYKKCGDRNTAIQLTCALCGVKVPELETFSFLLGNSGRWRDKRWARKIREDMRMVAFHQQGNFISNRIHV